nr:hypothetical protein [Tanacetum cinerariifolium]
MVRCSCRRIAFSMIIWAGRDGSGRENERPGVVVALSGAVFQDHLRDGSGYLKLLEACVWALIDVFPNSQAKNVVETVSRDREHQLGL